jgi:peroxiredoxin Q/BCP
MPLIDVGTAAPAFTLPDQNGQPISLANLRGKPVVLYFYPKADTPGCTTQACALNESLPRLSNLGAAVIGISPDATGPIARFADKFKLHFPLVGDEPAADGVPATINAYGVWGQKSMYGRSYWGVLRTTYILDGAGKVHTRIDNVKVDVHAQEVLTALEDLKAGKPGRAIASGSEGAAGAKPAAKKAAKKTAKKVAKKVTKPAKKATKKAAAKASPGKALKKVSKKATKKAGRK